MTEISDNNTMTANDNNSQNLIVLTPLTHGENLNVFRIDRLNLLSEDLPSDILHVAGGQHSGIVVRKMQTNQEINNLPALSETPNLTLDFNVFLVDSTNDCLKQENRSLKFYYNSTLLEYEKHHYTQEFFKRLLNDFPKDYLSFVKKMLKLMQTGFDGLKTIQIEMRLSPEKPVLPHVRQLNSSLENRSPSAQSVRELLEDAYPNGMMVDNLSHALQCSTELIFGYLEELQSKNLVTQLENGQWIRIDRMAALGQQLIVKQMPKVYDVDQPTVAIITALFVEKLVVDSVIENKQTFVRYKTDGESNIYTLGNIGPHRVVCTKLSAVGCSRSASIAAGSVTTRLLGCFQDIQHVFIVGVGGGVSHFTDKNENVRLGDVVVSCPVQICENGSKIQNFTYIHTDPLLNLEDNNALKINGYVVKAWTPRNDIISEKAVELSNEIENDLNPVWLDAKKESLRHLTESDTSKTSADPQNGNVNNNNNRNSHNGSTHSSSVLDFHRPCQSTDILTVHLNDGQVATVQHPDADRKFSRLHVGSAIASCGNRLDFETRDDFARKFKIKAFDVDFQTVIESILGNRINSWTLIRGISDYGDGTKNKEDWQPFAALQAALVAKMIVCKLPAFKQDLAPKN